ncbi:MAG: Ig-like domain repeat protein [Chloroflexi bacterium]|nr:Ig-like domain repeat protein [Chloroflexota bacterium]
MSHPRRSITIPILRFAALVLAGLVLPALSPALSVRAARPSDATSRLSDLPSAAQSTIAAAIGRDQPDYVITEDDGTYRAVNPAQGLAASFEAAGARIEAPGGLSWNPRVRAIGRDARPSRFPDPSTSSGQAPSRILRLRSGQGPGRASKVPTPRVVKGNRVEYRYSGLTEWYVNGPFGLEQGFTLMGPPPASREEGAVTLVLDLGGNTAKLDAGGRGVTLLGEDGEGGLRYTGLSACDAAGKALQAWLEIAGGSLLVRVDDTGAQYPIMIDPWIQAARLTASDGAAYDILGYSVAIDGDTIVAGASNATIHSNQSQGAAYVFVKPAGASWATATEAAKLVASDGAAGDEFGSAVAIQGDTIVVGAWHAAIGANVEQGAAYVYYRPPTGWKGYTTESVKLFKKDGLPEERFGMSVAVDNHIVVVGAPNALDDNPGGVGQGAAYMFVNPGIGPPAAGGAPGQYYTLMASDGQQSWYLGASVAISGDTVAVGSYNSQVGNNYGQGAVYVFEGPGSGGPGTAGTYTVTESTKLTAYNGGALDWFGMRVAMSADTIVVGGRHADGYNYWRGAAYVFVRPGLHWTNMTETAMLTPSDFEVDDRFASNGLAISGDNIVAGAWTSNGGTTSHQDTAYLFVKPSTGWASATETAKFSPGGSPLDAYHAPSVGVSGNVVVLGSLYSVVGANDQQGAAFVFTRARTTTTITSVSPEPSTVGQAVTVHFSVTSGASGTPTGNVTVSDSASAATCTATVAAGSCSMTFSTVGPHTLVAHYAGDSNYDASDSAGVAHTVKSALQQLYLPLTIR